MAKHSAHDQLGNIGLNGHKIIHDGLEDESGKVETVVGFGTPEGGATAATGSTFMRTDGDRATSQMMKGDGVGNTGWVHYGQYSEQANLAMVGSGLMVIPAETNTTIIITAGVGTFIQTLLPITPGRRLALVNLTGGNITIENTLQGGPNTGGIAFNTATDPITLVDATGLMLEAVTTGVGDLWIALGSYQ